MFEHKKVYAPNIMLITARYRSTFVAPQSVSHSVSSAVRTVKMCENAMGCRARRCSASACACAPWPPCGTSPDQPSGQRRDAFQNAGDIELQMLFAKITLSIFTKVIALFSEVSGQRRGRRGNIRPFDGVHKLRHPTWRGPCRVHAGPLRAVPHRLQLRAGEASELAV